VPIVPPTLIRAHRLVTCDSARDELGAIDDGAIAIEAERIVATGTFPELSKRFVAAPVIDHPGLVTPGLVDAHTHAAWMGDRAREYAMRMAGADYEAIAAAGGGIVASMRAVREASTEAIADNLRARLRRMATLGVTTIEVKSGYGLSEEAERRQLEAIASVSSDRSLPRVVATFLGLHAVPPEQRGDRRGYAQRCREWLDGIVRDRLAQFVDAYIDRAAFSVDEVRPTLERARELGLGLRLHVGQFADVGGAELAAELGAKSVDHLEHCSRSAADALAAAGTSAVLLPVASYTLRQDPPNVAQLREAGVALVVASDANPGTAPTESLPLAMAMAARSYGLTIDEVLLGATSRAAASLDLDCGVLRPGASADLVLWSLRDEHQLVQPAGVSLTAQVFSRGLRIA
jgi:imidazolonepropionase